jgi:aerobic-type carbon monoxide dehydrogenase small subunit (CoxS/CutS family)
MINGEDYEAHINPWWSLGRVLREELGLTGTKLACETGNCGSCTVLVEGKAIKSCLYLAIRAEGKEISTIEGLQDKDGNLHPLQQAFIDHFAVQCGYCTSGMILAAKALLDEKPNPSVEEIINGLAGNLCRCTGYVKILEAVLSVANEK